jgi:hypothetical protein
MTQPLTPIFGRVIDLKAAQQRTHSTTLRAPLTKLLSPRSIGPKVARRLGLRALLRRFEMGDSR